MASSAPVARPRLDAGAFAVFASGAAGKDDAVQAVAGVDVADDHAPAPRHAVLARLEQLASAELGRAQPLVGIVEEDGGALAAHIGWDLDASATW